MTESTDQTILDGGDGSAGPQRIPVNAYETTDALVVVAPMPGAVGGRGLLIVDALSDAWGVETSGGADEGKRVWFELNGPGGATAGPAGR